MPKKDLENLEFQVKGELEDLECELCKGHDYHFLLRENSLNLVKCKQCGLVSVNPKPTEKMLEEFYAKYFPPESELLWQNQMRRVFRKEGLNKINRECKTRGRLLDVGCGYGFFLKLMKENGWEVEGVELSTKAASYAKEKLGLTVFNGILEEAGFKDETFDVVTLWYVLEHLRHPMQILFEVHRIVKKDGLVIIRVPNSNIDIDRILIKLGKFGKRFFLINPPRHLFDYTPATISLMLKKAGFGGIKIKNSIPRSTGSLPELIRRYLWHWMSCGIFLLTGGRIVRGSSMTIYAVKI